MGCLHVRNIIAALFSYGLSASPSGEVGQGDSSNRHLEHSYSVLLKELLRWLDIGSLRTVDRSIEILTICRALRTGCVGDG